MRLFKDQGQILSKYVQAQVLSGRVVFRSRGQKLVYNVMMYGKIFHKVILNLDDSISIAPSFGSNL